MSGRFEATPRAIAWSSIVPDAILGVLWIWALVAGATFGRLRLPLLLAIPAAILYGIASLGHPWSVDVDDDGVILRAYGRAHRYRWADVAGAVRVRAFPLGERTLLRIGRFHPWRGRYWLTSALGDWKRLTALLEAHTRSGNPSSTSSGESAR